MGMQAQVFPSHGRGSSPNTPAAAHDAADGGAPCAHLPIENSDASLADHGAAALCLAEGQGNGLRSQTLQRWSGPKVSDAWSSASLLFEAIDGNPRHGVLALVVEGDVHAAGTLEVYERQGFWLAVPGAPWALAKAQIALNALGALRAPRSRIAGTPDQRFIFFNTWLQGVLVTQVERRDGPVVMPS
jgi:hypothetical protein